MNTEHGWISVGDSLPERGLVVLVSNGNAVIAAYQTTNGWYHTWKEMLQWSEKPTHWMPLPEPPPKPDEFEVWWSAQGYDPCRGSFGGFKECARDVWDAAIASTKPQ